VAVHRARDSGARCRLFSVSLAIGLIGSAGVARATTEGLSNDDLTRLSLEELAQVEITSVSKRGEPLGTAASAIFVISAEDIRRSGATSLPEVLRLAPNLQVQRLNSVDYAISARGFNGFLSANKLLVLIDGRSVYEPLHAGVFWDARLQMLHDIERIEVISGPGGALHGANAVNGVINIITRRAQDTLGSYVEAGAGNEDQLLALRYGGALPGGGAWRAHIMAVRRDDSYLASGGDATDETNGLTAGFRTDLPFAGGEANLQGDVFRNDVPLNYEVEGGNLVGRWSRALQDGGSIKFEGYLDRSRRTTGKEVGSEKTYDLHFQHDLAPRGGHQVVWGGGYRVIDSTFVPVPGSITFLDPQSRTITLADVLAQDQIALRDDLTLTLGFRYEHSSMSEDAYMPNVRLAWRRDNGSFVWAAVSRAVRTSTRLESDLVQVGFFAKGDFNAESVIAYELGYRASLGDKADVSVSAFYNDYDDLRTMELTAGGLPLHFASGGKGHASGVEAWGNYDVNSRWRLSAGVATLHKDFGLKPGVIDLAGQAFIGDDPDYQITLRSYANLTDSVQLDVRARIVDDLQPSGTASYADADVRLGWQVNGGTELSLTASNIFDNNRFESAPSLRTLAIGRSILLSLRLER